MMQYDLILSGGLVIDGKGNKPYAANVCVQNGKIARITTETVDAKEILERCQALQDLKKQSQQNQLIIGASSVPGQCLMP